jgi:translation initiation factor 2 beta subunit (eIF-2beta)/eIF-5
MKKFIFRFMVSIVLDKVSEMLNNQLMENGSVDLQVRVILSNCTHRLLHDDLVACIELHKKDFV